MGLLSWLFNSNASTSNDDDYSDAEELLNKTLEYFRDEKIRYECPADYKAVAYIYEALTEQNENTSDASDMRDGLQTLDNNLYYFIRALVSQNFMLMRKIDSLSDKVDQLQSELDNLTAEE